MHNNVFYSDSGTINMTRQVEAVWAGGSAVIAGNSNWVKAGAVNVPPQWDSTRYGTAPGFSNFAGLDLRPLTDSVELVDQADNAPSSAAGYPFPTPLFPPLMHPPEPLLLDVGSAELRPVDGLLDIGAFEAGIVIIPGDLDGDGSVDLRDAILSLQTVTGDEVEDLLPDFPSSGADVDGDGKVSLTEAVYILQETAD